MTDSRSLPQAAPAGPGDARAARRRSRGILVALIVPVLLLVAWTLATDVFRLFLPNQLPSPGETLRAARDLAAGGDLLRHVSASVGRVLLGFSIGAVIAVVVGSAVGLSRTAESMLDPTLQAVRSIPSLAWVPFLLLWLGIDEAPKITLIAIGAFFPVYLNLVSGIRQADRKLVEVGYVFGFSQADLVRRIVLPSALPYLITGLRVGFGQAWLFLVAAELIASTRGLGFMLIDGQNSARPDIMLVSIILLALLGKFSDSLLRVVERRALAWTDTFGGN